MRRLPPTKLTLGLACLMALSLMGCTTVENRRDLYFPGIVEGPYTRLLHHGIPTTTPRQTKASTSTTAKTKGSSGKEVVKPRG